MNFLVGLLLAFLGMLFFAVSSKKYRIQLFTSSANAIPDSPYVWGAVACLFMIMLAVFSIKIYGLGIGLVWFCAFICISGWLLSLIIAFKKSHQ
jgi:hypothetical protein